MRLIDVMTSLADCGRPLAGSTIPEQLAFGEKADV
jgi:hypothetical protein